MKLIIDDIKLQPNDPEEALGRILSASFGISDGYPFVIIRRSIDARKKGRIVYRYRLMLDLPEPEALRLLEREGVSIYREPDMPAVVKNLDGLRVIVIGAGPAGLFCALRLIEHGAIVEILERGRPVEERLGDIRLLERDGTLDPESNVLFGEGGAGAYSDGKLTARTRRPESAWFFETLVSLGAPPVIRSDAHPHLGTDRLAAILTGIRARITAAGSRIRFSTRIDDILAEHGAVAGVRTAAGEEIRCGRVVLATGHSARDTYAMLAARGLSLRRKDFAVGARIEHPAELINAIQYGPSARNGSLPPAEYSLAWKNPATGRGVYSFCMCPGGMVINASSESGMLCTNGMSRSKRDGDFSNAALAVTIRADDFPGGPLAGIDFQRDIERRAYAAGGGDFRAPAIRVQSFLAERGDATLPALSYCPGARPGDPRDYLPPFVIAELLQALPIFDRRMRGFAGSDAVLIGAETRTSSPVRILRDDSFQSVSLAGLYPAGEGAGYAGGIVSSAVDGIRIADAIARQAQA
ncbi:MAG TPA: NAD(P)/FAD-dependent oxidoreductase [Spirochaetota bacterium]|nr:NAD(P)/FAD-dependent oxidoreductase [Spirochaetota bacterium]HNT10042.1 NAD(P)/FAD-dependent oxidoreductase [Spirochaetota bacterium]